MNVVRALRRILLAACLTAAAVPAAAQPPGAAKPLSEADVVKLIELGVGDEAVIGRIAKGGVTFAPSDDVFARLEGAGASRAVLDAVRSSAKPAGPPAGAVTFQNVRQLLELGIDESAILARLDKSPTRFVLDADQKSELVRLGASPKLIAAMEGMRERPKNDEIGDFLLILDCSNSMSERTPGGTPKMEAAKKAVSDLIARVPDGRRMSFMVYGHDRALACKAVAVVRPMANVTPEARGELIGLVDSLRPVGSTPIALALNTAAAQLDPNVPSTLVLVSDGVETCKGDPAAEAAALAARFNLTFGVVGFDVKAEEKAALERIATAGKGRYLDARSAAELFKAAAEIAAVEPGADEAGNETAETPVEIWASKSYDSWGNGLTSEVVVNGRSVGTLGSEGGKVSLNGTLRRGWNTIDFKTSARPAPEENQLLIVAGHTSERPDTGETVMTDALFTLGNGGGWTLKDGAYTHPQGGGGRPVVTSVPFYYAGPDAGPAAGGYVLSLRNSYDSWPSPLTVTAFVNGTPVTSHLNGSRVIDVTPLLKPGKNELKVVTRPVSGAVQVNNVSVQVGGPAEISPDGKVRFQPLATVDSEAAWKIDGGKIVGKGRPDQKEFVRTVTFQVDDLPR